MYFRGLPNVSGMTLHRFTLDDLIKHIHRSIFSSLILSGYLPLGRFDSHLQISVTNVSLAQPRYKIILLMWELQKHHLTMNLLKHHVNVCRLTLNPRGFNVVR